MSREDFIHVYSVAMFGDTYDEYGIEYAYEYRWELVRIYKDMVKDIKFIKSFYKSISEFYNYVRELLIEQARTFYDSANEIKAPEVLEQLAFDIAKDGLE